nr:unnamed protein product [Callosobruchus chinensis]
MFYIYCIFALDAFSLGTYLAIQQRHILLLGGTYFTVGLLKSVLALLAVVCSPIVVHLSNEKNKQNVMVWCLLFSVFANLLSSTTSSILLYSISRLICVASIPVQTVLKSTVTEFFEGIEKSSQILRTLGYIGTVGFMIGRLVGGHFGDYARGTDYVYTSMIANNLISIVLVKSIPDTRSKRLKKSKKAEKRTRKDANILEAAFKETSSLFIGLKEILAHPEYRDVFAMKLCIECVSVMNMMALGTTLAAEFKMSMANIGYVFVFNMIVPIATRSIVNPNDTSDVCRIFSRSTSVQAATYLMLSLTSHLPTFVMGTVANSIARPFLDAALDRLLLEKKADNKPKAAVESTFRKTVTFAQIVGPVATGIASCSLGIRSGFVICALFTIVANRLVKESK